jgi:phosphate transport system ATP-binding protein
MTAHAEQSLGAEPVAPGAERRTIPATMAINVQTQGSAAIAPAQASEPRLRADGLGVAYGAKVAVKDVSINVPDRSITAIIGPSGSGKSTVLRCFNRMNDLVPTARVSGSVQLDGEELNTPALNVVELRRRVGLVFQKPNPFPMSIYENVAYGPRRLGVRDKARLDEIVERSLRQAALWEEVRDDWRRQSGTALSGGQQQRLCIARVLATEPEVILMDEPCSALDPISTLQIETLMRELIERYTIVIVTHNMQQAARVSDDTVFMSVDEQRAGYVVESGPTSTIFTNPSNKITEDYITGRFG